MAVECDLLVRNAQAVVGAQMVFCDIIVRGGKVAGILPWGQAEVSPRSVVDADGRWVIPGAIDTHCHMGQIAPEFEDRPGLGAASNFAWESRAAAAGGITTVLNYLRFGQGSMLDMYDLQAAAVREQSIVDVLFHGYIMNNLHLAEVETAVARGIRSFKIFLPYRGEEARALGGISSLNYGELQIALRKLQALGAQAMIHAEDGDIVDISTVAMVAGGSESLSDWEASRPTAAEGTAAYAALYLAQREGCKVTIVHVSSPEAVAARAALPVADARLESCPHYLVLAVEDELGPEGKVAPPLRHRDVVDGLWHAVESGAIDFFGSDHNVWPQDAKCAMWTAKAGLPGIDMMVPLLLTEGCIERGIPLPRMVELIATNAARRFGLYPQKGGIHVGADADLVVVETGKKVVKVRDSLSAVDYSPYEGMVVKAWPMTTIRGGEILVRNCEPVDGVGRGRVLNTGREGAGAGLLRRDRRE